MTSEAPTPVDSKVEELAQEIVTYLRSCTRAEFRRWRRERIDVGHAAAKATIDAKANPLDYEQLVLAGAFVLLDMACSRALILYKEDPGES